MWNIEANPKKQNKPAKNMSFPFAFSPTSKALQMLRGKE